MQKIIGAHRLETEILSVVSDVVQQHDSYVVTQDDQPEAAIVPYREYLRLKELSESEILRRFDLAREEIDARTADLTDEEIAIDVELIRSELPD